MSADALPHRRPIQRAEAGIRRQQGSCPTGEPADRPDCRELTKQALTEIVAEVNHWYDALYAKLAA